MHDLVEAFLSIPVGGRATIFVGILFLLWCTLGRPVLKITSIFPWLLKKLFWGIYLLLEIPVSAMHSKFGNVFGVIDQGLEVCSEKVYNFMDKLFGKMNKPKTIYVGPAFVMCLVTGFYLIIPITAKLTENPFTFWQKSYIKKEVAVVQWMDDKGWLEKRTGTYTEKSSEVAANASTQKKYFKLSKKGAKGSNIRNKPNLNGSRIVTVVSKNDLLLYLNESSTEHGGGLWYKVKAPDGNIGWISSILVQQVK